MLFTLANVSACNSFIFAFFWSSLSEVSLNTVWRLALASAKISFAFWSSVRFKLSTAACSLPPPLNVNLTT